MPYIASTDPAFLKKVENWFETRPEILALVRFRCGGGSREYRLFFAYSAFMQMIFEAPAGACITVFREYNLPLRGVVDENLIRECLELIKDGAKYLMFETVPTVAGKRSWYHYGSGESLGDLKYDLEQSIGRPVVVGYHPSMSTGPDKAAHGVVPDHDGVVRAGPY